MKHIVPSVSLTPPVALCVPTSSDYNDLTVICYQAVDHLEVTLYIDLRSGSARCACTAGSRAFSGRS